MKTLIPGTVASLGLSSWITSSALSERSFRGFRRINIRPMLDDTVLPTAPTFDMKSLTFGSCCTISASFFWCTISDSKDISSAASVKQTIRAVSSLGRNPLGVYK